MYLLLASVLVSASAHAQNSKHAGIDSKVDSFAKTCQLAAETAKLITADTLTSGKFDPEAAFVKRTTVGSEVRTILLPMFNRGSSIRTVLIGLAGTSAAFLAPTPTDRKESESDIANFAYRSVLNQCLVDAIVARASAS